MAAIVVNVTGASGLELGVWRELRLCLDCIVLNCRGIGQAVGRHRAKSNDAPLLIETLYFLYIKFLKEIQTNNRFCMVSFKTNSEKYTPTTMNW